MRALNSKVALRRLLTKPIKVQRFEDSLRNFGDTNMRNFARKTIEKYNQQLFNSIICKAKLEREFDPELSEMYAPWDTKDINSEYHTNEKNICNVIDMSAALRDILLDGRNIEMNNAFNKGKRRLATLDIYEDRSKEMEFVLSSSL